VEDGRERHDRGKEGFSIMGSDRIATRRDIAVLLCTVLFALSNLAAVGLDGRERAKRMVCLGNLKQLSLAWLMYARENEGKIVNGATGYSYQNMVWGDHTDELAWVYESSSDWETGIAGIKKGALWPYVEDARIYRCPVGPPKQTLTYSITFAMNAVLHLQQFEASTTDKDWHGKFVKKTDEILKPAVRLVFADEGSMTPDAYAAHYSQERWFDLPPVQHNDGGTLSFADGHVEYWKWKSPETVAIGRSGAPGQGQTCHSCDACEDLHRLQTAIWGRLGYEPSCGEVVGDARE